MKTLTDFAAAVFIVSAFCSYVYLWLRKKQFWEYLQIHADKWLEMLTKKRSERLNEYFSCVLCVGFLLSVIVTISLFLITGDWAWLVIPFCTPALIRRWT